MIFIIEIKVFDKNILKDDYQIIFLKYNLF